MVRIVFIMYMYMYFLSFIESYVGRELNYLCGMEYGKSVINV